MSCTFWNRRRRLRQQLGVEREAKEEIPETMVEPSEVPDRNAKKPPPRKKEAQS